MRPTSISAEDLYTLLAVRALRDEATAENITTHLKFYSVWMTTTHVHESLSILQNRGLLELVPPKNPKPGHKRRHVLTTRGVQYIEEAIFNLNALYTNRTRAPIAG